jgi:hypothetical protein
MASKETVSVPKAAFDTVFGILYNPAKPRDPNNGTVERTREDVPWVVIIPKLSIVAMITDKDGDPVVGHVNPGYAASFAARLYNRLVQNPELLQSYREQPDNYDIEKGYMGKMIPIQFQV